MYNFIMKKVDQISRIYLSWGVWSQSDTCRIRHTTKLGWIGCSVHLVSLRDKHWRSILDTTPPNAHLRS